MVTVENNVNPNPFLDSENTAANQYEDSDKKDYGVLDYIKSIDLKIHGKYSEEDLKDARKEIEERLKKAKGLYSQYVVPQKEKTALKINEDIYTEINTCFERLEPIRDSGSTEEDEIYEDLYGYYSKLIYSHETVKKETKIIDSNIEFSENEGMIRLCKNVRIMEDIINKICANNIDKSIIGGDHHFDSIRYGFEWLFCHEDLNVSSAGSQENESNSERKHMDIRDSTRYLDYIKYQIMVASKYAEKSFRSSEDIDDLFDKIKYVFEDQDYKKRYGKIQDFKNETKKLIRIFFEIYECLVNYRDELFREEEIRKSLGKGRAQNLINIDIINLSSISVRVLIDRFVSFVKISDLNFGNSTFKCAWFNYSELSKSNYSGSDFKYARIENARMKDCDISTCNLTLADGGSTDFSRSNFTYSNLCGINLIGAVLNYCELQNAAFSDPNIRNYKEGFRSLIPKKSERTPENVKRNQRLYSLWKADSSNNDSAPTEKVEAILTEIKMLPTCDLKIIADDCRPILPYNLQTDRISGIIDKFIRQKLYQYISKELVFYIRERVKKQDRTKEPYKKRIANHGKVYLDAANLNNASVKYSQLSGNNLSRISMSQASFENADLSSTSMYYVESEESSFILSNLNNVDCFESLFSMANFSSAVANNSMFVNCNLKHTNWNKAILINSLFADFSKFRETIIAKPDESCLLDLCTNRYSMQRDIRTLDVKLDEVNCGETKEVVNCAGKRVAKKEKSFWQNDCSLNDASFIDSIADRVIFINITADHTTFNRSSFKNAIWFNCRTFLADYIETDFRYSNVSFCCMGQSNFTRANMTSMILRYIDFSNSNFYASLFNLSDLDHVLFSNANTRFMNLSGAKIINSGFEDCVFENVNLTSTKFINCIFSHVDFIDLIGFRSSQLEFQNCYFDACTYKEGKRRQQLINGFVDPREIVSEN